ncbi:MAG: trypsin-like peptidase domain-containing protein [Victivallales bacterium]|nr:trypsin-like peptidase domain-containing protein [Victivallales bacterium]
MRFLRIIVLPLLLCVVLRAEGSVRETATVRAVKRVMPIVVSIGTEQTLQVKDPYITRLNEYFSVYRYRHKEVTEYTPLGSGILLHERGLVVTNWHVVRSAEKILVKVVDGTSYRARLIGFDAPADLALLLLYPNGKDERLHLAHAHFAQAGDLMLGETVLTLGNPFGLENSVSQGLLSATNRSLSGDKSGYGDILQTDAAVNPGNSGGPLVNLEGDVIGINQAILSEAQGIGFAIPVSRIEGFLATWLRPESFSSARLGLSYGPGDGGVRLEVEKDSAASQAGLKTGEMVVAVGKERTPVRRPLELGMILWQLHADEQVELQLSDGRSVAVNVGRMTESQLLAERLGVRLQKLTPNLNRALGLPETARGLALSDILPEKEFQRQGMAWRSQLKRGDIFLEANGVELKDVSTLAKLLDGLSSGDVLQFSLAVLEPHRRIYLETNLGIVLK